MKERGLFFFISFCWASSFFLLGWWANSVTGALILGPIGLSLLVLALYFSPFIFLNYINAETVSENLSLHHSLFNLSKYIDIHRLKIYCFDDKKYFKGTGLFIDPIGGSEAIVINRLLLERLGPNELEVYFLALLSQYPNRALRYNFYNRIIFLMIEALILAPMAGLAKKLGARFNEVFSGVFYIYLRPYYLFKEFVLIEELSVNQNFFPRSKLNDLNFWKTSVEFKVGQKANNSGNFPFEGP